MICTDSAYYRHLRACALRISQVLNYSDLARDTGIAPNTARKWLGLLEASAVVAIECKWQEHPGSSDAAGPRALESAEGKRVKDKTIVCRTQAAYKLADGTRVVSVADALKRLAAR